MYSTTLINFILKEKPYSSIEKEKWNNVHGLEMEKAFFDSISFKEYNPNTSSTDKSRNVRIILVTGV